MVVLKKNTILGIILAVLGIIAACIYCLVFAKRINDCVISVSEAQDIKKSHTLNKDLKPELFFGREKLVLDSAEGEYYYSLISGDSHAYNPEVKGYVGSNRIHVAVVEADKNKDGAVITDQKIREADEISLLFYDEKNYTEAKVSCTTLPIMNITCGREIGETDVPVSVELLDNRENAAKRMTESIGSMRVRGGTTRAYPKSPYKLTLDKTNKEALLGMREDDDWVLYAAYNDQEKVRNVFSQNFWSYSCATDNGYNIDTGLEYKYLELFVDGEYRGLYALGYTPDERNMKLDDEVSEGFYKKIGANIENYVVKNKDVKLGTTEEFKLQKMLYDYYFGLQDNCDDAGYLKNVVDMDNAIDFYLYICLIQGRDNLRKNYYSVLKKSNDGYKMVYIPWDMDISWGNAWTPILEQNNTAMYKNGADENYLFTDGCMYWMLFDNDNEAYDMLIKKYEKLRKGRWSDDVVKAFLDKYEKDIFFSGAYLRDKKRWPDGNYIESGEEISLARFKTFVAERFSEMDSYIVRLKNERSENPFVTQTLCFGDYGNSDFIVRFDDREVLEDKEYKELLEKSGVDLGKIKSDAGFILHRAKDGAQQEIPFDKVGSKAVDTIFGKLTIGQSDEKLYETDADYSVIIDGIDYMDVVEEYLPIGMSVISKAKHEKKVHLDKNFRSSFSLDVIENKELFLKALKFVPGSALILLEGYSEDKLSFLNGYDVDLGDYGSLKEAIDNEKKLAILLNGDSKEAFIINNAFVSGTVYETDIGTYSYFEMDGMFGIYVNDNEIYTGEIEQKDLPTRIVYSVDWKELLWENYNEDDIKQ